MKNYFLFLIFIQTLSFGQSHKPFVGKLIYKVDFSDSLKKLPSSTSYMTLYTNDTIVRTEAETFQIGKQITIRHLILNKYYILLEFNGNKYAIQHQASQDTTPSKYIFHKRIGGKKIAGKRAKKITVNSPNLSQETTMYYYKNISPKYVEAIRGIPGLPVEYYIQTEEGIYHYQLIEFSQEQVSRDLFGIPSEYQKVSFDEFMESVMKTN